jgi:uncharacterized protein
VDALKEFKIPYVGLKNGEHLFEFHITKKFFDSFESTAIHDGDIKVKLKFDKKDNFFTLDFSIDGTVKIPCDRCLELFDEEIFNDFKIFVKFEEREGKKGDEEDVIYLSKGDSHLDLSEVIYDFIHVSVPMQNIHPDDENGQSTCDPEVLKKLEIRKDEEEVDPRWEALLKLKKNDK